VDTGGNVDDAAQQDSVAHWLIGQSAPRAASRAPLEGTAVGRFAPRVRDQPPLSIEVDYGSATTRGRPPARAWLVRLSSGERSVIVAWGLSRTVADHLADRIGELLVLASDQPWNDPASAARPS